MGGLIDRSLLCAFVVGGEGGKGMGYSGGEVLGEDIPGRVLNESVSERERREKIREEELATSH